MNNDKLISILVRNVESVLFQDYAKSVSSVNEKGRFDILPLHSNFISIIKEKIVIYDKNNQKKEIKIDQGILRIVENKVEIYLGVEALWK